MGGSVPTQQGGGIAIVGGDCGRLSVTLDGLEINTTGGAGLRVTGDGAVTVRYSGGVVNTPGIGIDIDGGRDDVFTLTDLAINSGSDGPRVRARGGGATAPSGGGSFTFDNLDIDTTSGNGIDILGVGGTFSIRGGSINTTGGAGVNAQQSQGPVVIDGVSISTETGLGASFNGFRGDVLVSGSTVRGQPNPGPRGQVTFDGTSSIYTLPSDFFGTDGFTYTIENGTLSDLETGAIIAAGGAGGDRQAPRWTCRSSGARSAARAPDWTSRASLALSVALSETRSSPTTPLAST